MVESTTEYTDLLTVSFRQLAMKWKDKDFKLAYMDTYRQASFYKKLELSDDNSKKTCENGYKSRSVCVTEKIYNKLIDFCVGFVITKAK